ncbi:MAG: maleylpyruvate isomerase family mycothiol-dependent enzyme [Candidatus Dormiibacterota bacterium]
MAGNQWPLIRAERVALIGDLENVSDPQWSTQSLCSAWTVRDVLAHMTTTAKMTPGRFVGRFAGTGFQFNAMNEKGVKEELGATPADTLAGFKAQLDRTTAPPGPLDAMVGEIVIHSQDIRRPLGIAHTFQPEALTMVGDFVIRGNLLLGGKRRATGLTLNATDVDWTRGAGPAVNGPLASIILALTGRNAGLADLSGDGLEILAARI